MEFFPFFIAQTRAHSCDRSETRVGWIIDRTQQRTYSQARSFPASFEITHHHKIVCIKRLSTMFPLNFDPVEEPRSYMIGGIGALDNYTFQPLAEHFLQKFYK